MQHSNIPDKPSPGLIALLQVIQWAVPTIKHSAKLLLLAVPLHAIILLLWWVVATNEVTPCVT